MINQECLDRIHRFLWNQYGSKGIDLCSVQTCVWIGRACKLDPVSKKDEIIKAFDKLKSEGKITVYESRVEIHGPNGEHFHWDKLIENNS